MVLQRVAAFNHDEARTLLSHAAARLPQPPCEQLAAVLEALAKSIDEDENFIESAFREVNEGKRIVRLNEFYSKSLKGVITKVNRTYFTFKLESESAGAAIHWTDLSLQEVLGFFSLFRRVNIEQALPFGCFCFHRGYNAEAMKFLRMAQGAADETRSRIASKLLELCE